MYYTYMIRCKDNSIYTGMTSDLDRRVKEHIEKDKKCAKYTSSHSATKLERAWISEDRIYASKLEYWIKKLTKKEKEDLIRCPRMLNKLLGDKVDSKKYKLINHKLKEEKNGQERRSKEKTK